MDAHSRRELEFSTGKVIRTSGSRRKDSPVLGGSGTSETAQGETVKGDDRVRRRSPHSEWSPSHRSYARQDDERPLAQAPHDEGGQGPVQRWVGHAGASGGAGGGEGTRPQGLKE